MKKNEKIFQTQTLDENLVLDTYLEKERNEKPDFKETMTAPGFFNNLLSRYTKE